MTRLNKTKLTLTGATSLLALSLATGVAYAEEKQFDIEAQPLAKALLEFNEQSGLTVAAPRELVEDKRSSAVRGEMEPDEALEKILSGSGLRSNELPTGAYTITLASADVTEPAQAPFRVAQLDQEEDVRGIDGRDDEDEEARQDVIVVTGTNIRGIAPDSSPTLTFDRDDILNSGAATAQDFIQTLPQNFGGGSNADARALPNDINSGFNNPSEGGSLGSSVNLRGLGSGSTLVLLNGRRLAPSSGVGDFVDVSLIPASALERVEVLTDGASSIYGGDAVAGVVNFVLREDFEGVEGSLRYGTVTDGSLDEYRASLTAGTNWTSGNALVVYEFYDQADLGADERDFSRGATLPHDLLPSQQRHSVLATVSQDITSNFEVFGDVLYSTRDSEYDITDSASNLITSTITTESLSVAGGASWEITNSWIADVTGTYSEVSTETAQIGVNPRERKVDADIWALDAKVSGDLFSLPGGDVKLAFGGHYREETFENTDVLNGVVERDAERDASAIFGELFIPLVGPSNETTGIDRLELNISGRTDDYSDFGTTTNAKFGVLWALTDSLRLRSSYSTSFNPPPLGRIGASDLTASAVPSSLFNGIFGLTPGDPSIADVVMITVFGTDKNLEAETSEALTFGFDFNESWNNHTISVTGNYFKIDFSDRLGDTPIPDGSVVFNAPNIAFNNPELFPEGTVIFFPTQQQLTELIASLDNLGVFPGLDPLDAEIINFADVVRNLSRTTVKGIDFDASYSFDADVGNFSVGLSGTYISEFDQQAAPTTASVEQINTLYNPVDLKMRGRIGFARDSFTANLYTNFTDGYRVSNTLGAASVDSWTTVDATLAYRFDDQSDSSFINGTAVRISVANLFDSQPPETPSNPVFGIFGFDPTNASPLGRFVSFEITKSF